MSRDFALPDADATAALGRAVAHRLDGRAGSVVYLQGDLGAGKTTLARALLGALGVTGAIRSPTYTLLEPYRAGRHEVIHLDLYRLRDAEELESLGLRDYAPERTLWLVEWPERGAGHLPAPDLVIALEHRGAARGARLSGSCSDIQVSD